MTYHGCGLWWWMWILCGADVSETIVDWDEKGYLEETCKKTNNPYPPMGRERMYDVDVDVPKNPIPEELRSGHFNVQVLFYKMRLYKLLELCRNVYPLYVIVQVILCSVIPCIWILLLYGVIPMSDPTLLEDRCDYGKMACWHLFTNPISEVTIQWCVVTLLFPCIDDNLPWRPFWMYLPLMALIYIVQVLFFLPFVLTIRTFEYSCLVSFLLSDTCTFFYLLAMKNRIIDFRKENKEDPELREVVSTRYNAYLQSIPIRFVTVGIYATYLYGIIRIEEDETISGLNFLLAFSTVFLRVYLQRLFSVFHKDMNFYMAFLGLYAGTSMYFAFAVPGFEGNEILNYATAAIVPLTSLVVGCLQQTEIWFRFRCWIKKTYCPTLCCRNDLLAFPIEEDLNFDGRGSDNQHPAYRRTKVHNAIMDMMAAMYTSLFYLLVSPSLRNLPNKLHFPYTSDNKIIGISPSGDASFNDEDWEDSMIFSAFVLVYSLVSFLLYKWYIFIFYPSMKPVFKEFFHKPHNEPDKLGYQMMIVSLIGVGVVKLFLSYSRVWWVETDLCSL